MSWAYEFECDLPILAILAALNQAGPWLWIERDKDAFGTYISSVSVGDLRTRIYSAPHNSGENGPKYTADFRTAPECKFSRAVLEATFREMLVTLLARNVVPGEYWD